MGSIAVLPAICKGIFMENKNEKNVFKNCHRTNSKPKPSNSVPDNADTDSEQDSSTSKYVVQHDNRERRDGPGGN